jgi:hypothetical protein
VFTGPSTIVTAVRLQISLSRAPSTVYGWLYMYVGRVPPSGSPPLGAWRRNATAQDGYEVGTGKKNFVLIHLPLN